MDNTLKIGQRIDVYEDTLCYHCCGHDDDEWEDAVVLRWVPESNGGYRSRVIFNKGDVKKIGTFIVKEVKTNTDPITII